MQKILDDSISVSYESDAVSNYLVVALNKKENIIDYQVKMIQSNPANFLLPLTIRQKNDKVSIFYNIASKISLTQFMKKNKLEKRKLIQLLKNITKSFIDCSNYLLTENSFLLIEDYIFINQNTLETSFAYIPIDMKGHFVEDFKRITANIIIEYAESEQANEDELIKNILDYLKIEQFSIIDFYNLLNKKDIDNTENIAVKKQLLNDSTNNFKISIPKTEPRQNYKREFRKIVKEQISKAHGESAKVIRQDYAENNKSKFNLLITIGLLQMFIIISIILGYQLVFASGKFELSNVLGIVLIAGAADFFAVRLILEKSNTTFGEILKIIKKRM